METWIPEGVASAVELSFEQRRDRERTITGLTLFVVGFALVWIPYVSYLADLLFFIGLIFLLLGRWGFDDRHHKFVVGGAVLLLFLIIASLVVAASFAAQVVSDSQSSDTLSQLAPILQGQFDALFEATAVIGLLIAVVYVLIPYGIAQPRTRQILWLAFLVQIVTTVAVLSLALSQVNSAISQATSGTSLNTAPISQLQSTALVFGLLNFFPSVMFAWAFYRARSDAIVRALAPVGATFGASRS